MSGSTVARPRRTRRKFILLGGSVTCWAIFAAGVAALPSPHHVLKKAGFKAHDAVSAAADSSFALAYVGRFEGAQVRGSVLDSDQFSHPNATSRRIRVTTARCTLDQLEDDETSGTYSCHVRLNDQVAHRIRNVRTEAVCGTSLKGASDCEDVSVGSSG